MRRWLWALLLALGACTLLTGFDPEGQGCDTSAPPAQQCQGNFHCAQGRCVRGAYDAGSPDGG